MVLRLTLHASIPIAEIVGGPSAKQRGTRGGRGFDRLSIGYLLIHESPLTDALFLLVSKSDEVTTT